jgi:competence protein ComGF
MSKSMDFQVKMQKYSQTCPQWNDEEKLVLCAMYLVFGLSLIAMCFNLVQEDVKAKCRTFMTSGDLSVAFPS